MYIRRTMLGLGLMFAMGATNAQAQTVTVLHRFGEPGGPLQPQYPGVVAQGRDGALYTTAPNGGAQASGAVFRVTPSGSFNVVYSFTSSGSGGDGYLPRSGLTLGTDGNFYGSSSAGGGTIFKVTPNGNGTGLHSFLYTKDDGLNPYAPPIEGPDGNFYGTTTSNQAKTGSTMYRITPSGDLTTIYSFGFSGSDVVAPLVLGTDGNFYGTASQNGAHGRGSVFKATITGQVTYIYNFDGTNGGYPIAPLIQATDGNFYGTTTIGGDHDDGVVFKLTPAGQITVLHSFNGTDGKTPYAGLVQANDGNFYGAAYEGGTSGYGTLYKIKPQGAFSVLYNFDGMGTGDYPEVTLTQHTNGLFYSDTYITSSGGTGWPGLFYSLNVGLPPFIRLQPSYGTAGASIGIFGQGFTGTQSVTFNGKPARFTVTSDTYLTATAPSGVTTGPVIVTTPGGALTSNISFRSTEVAAPSISAVVSASGFGGFSTVAPGSWVEIYGSNLSNSMRGWTGSDFNGNSAPTSLDGVKVSIGGQLAFVDYISSGQVNALLPSNIGAGPTQITLTNGNATSAPLNITVNNSQVGLLAPSAFKIGAKQYVAALLPDGVTFILPPGSIAGVPSRQAKPGETIIMYGIGFGPVTPNIPAGQIVTQPNQLMSPLQIMFGQTPAQLSYFGLAPNFVGLYQFNVVVPAVPNNDLVPLTFNLGGVAGTQTLYIAVQQ